MTTEVIIISTEQHYDTAVKILVTEANTVIEQCILNGPGVFKTNIWKNRTVLVEEIELSKEEESS